MGSTFGNKNPQGIKPKTMNKVLLLFLFAQSFNTFATAAPSMEEKVKLDLSDHCDVNQHVVMNLANLVDRVVSREGM